MAILLKTKDLANTMKETIRAEVAEWKQQGVYPALGVLLVKGDPASEHYARTKTKIGRKLGVDVRIIEFESKVSEQILLQEIERLNRDPDVHGIMLELPVPETISVQRLSRVILQEKDVDGISAANKFACLTGGEGIYPATPKACIRLLKHFGIPLEGKHVVLVGCGETVGKPLLHLLLRENATLTICHFYTQDLAQHVRKADLLIAAAGCPNLITKEMVHPDLVVIDVGINETEHGITGDVSPEAAAAVKAVTPVPGGVGTLTTMMLFENVMQAVRLQNRQNVAVV